MVQVVLMRTNPEVTNNHLIVCLGDHDTPCEGTVTVAGLLQACAA